jgi:CBS domain-containing protein
MTIDWRSVQDVMTRNVITVLKYENVMHVAGILSEKNISGLPQDKQTN